MEDLTCTWEFSPLSSIKIGPYISWQNSSLYFQKNEVCVNYKQKVTVFKPNINVVKGESWLNLFTYRKMFNFKIKQIPFDCIAYARLNPNYLLFFKCCAAQTMALITAKTHCILCWTFRELLFHIESVAEETIKNMPITLQFIMITLFHWEKSAVFIRLWTGKYARACFKIVLG